jgi:flavin-dependent dehydrogenase
MAVHDVAIIGAGPAGTSCAIELLQREPGARVLLLEGVRRANALDPGQPGAGHSMCSGGLPTLMAQRMIGWEVPRSVVMADVRRAVVQTPGHEMVVTPAFLGSEQPLGVITNRKKLDDWLLGWARKLGVEYHAHAQVVGAERNGRWRLRTKDGGLHEARFLVGADGPESFVARRFLGAPDVRPADMYHASEVYVRAPAFPRETVLFQWRNSRIRGYYWSFDAGDVVKVGLCTTRASGVNPGKENEHWRQRMAEQFGEQGFLSKPVEHVGGRITASPPLKRVGDARGQVAVVGEAARAVWAEIAAGDASAFETGRALGRALAEGEPQEYQRWWRRRSYGIHVRHWRAKEMLLGMSDAELDRTLRLLSQFRPTSKDIHRDARRFALYALAKEPGLIAKALWKAATA